MYHRHAATWNLRPRALNPLDADNAPVALFTSAFLSATLLPGASEVTLLAALDAGADPALMLLVATAGNTLGGLTSWVLGFLFSRVGRASAMANARRRRALDAVRRWGWPALVLAWAPVIGDALCVAAGWLRINLVLAGLAMAVGKCLRYLAIIQLYHWA